MFNRTVLEFFSNASCAELSTFSWQPIKRIAKSKVEMIFLIMLILVVMP